MFALRNTFQRNSAIVGRRLASAGALPKPPLPACYLENNDFKANFLSDPGAYPLILIMCGAMSLIVGMSANCLIYGNKDLRITPSHKQTILRDWGDQYVEPMTHKMAMGPIIMHGKDYRSTWQEGLGIDHEEWKKQKAEYEKGAQ